MDKRKSSILAYMGFLIGVMALGGVVYTTALAEPWVNPICQAATEGMTPEKQASHQAYCAERAAAENRTPPAVKSTSPSFVPDLSNAPKGGPIFGIDDSLPIPPWMIED